MEHLVYPVAWISSSCAAIAGVYFTGSAWCIFVMVLPALITSGRSNSDGQQR